MKDVIIVRSTKHTEIISKLKEIAPNGAHFTNGTFAFDKRLIVPTTLAGFKRVSQVYPHLPLVIAVNSDKSMAVMGKTDYESEDIRAKKVALPLQELFPDNQVIIIYYDEKTPTSLYEALHKHHLTRTLHKWGYGTTPDAPLIEGASCFKLVYGFPLPNDKKPLCYLDTPKAPTPQKIIVDDLRGKLIDKNNQLLFEVPDTLLSYAIVVPFCTCQLAQV